MWSYAKRAIGTHVLRQKHWPGNAMMHPPDPKTFATSVAIRLVVVDSPVDSSVAVIDVLELKLCQATSTGWV